MARSHQSIKTPSQGPPMQVRILSRPLPLDKSSSHSTPEFSEFEAPRDLPEAEVSEPSSVVKDSPTGASSSAQPALQVQNKESAKPDSTLVVQLRGQVNLADTKMTVNSSSPVKSKLNPTSPTFRSLATSESINSFSPSPKSRLNPTSPDFRSFQTPTESECITTFSLPPKSKLNPTSPTFRTTTFSLSPKSRLNPTSPTFRSTTFSLPPKSKLNPTSPTFRSLETPTESESITNFSPPPARSKFNPTSPIFRSLEIPTKSESITKFSPPPVRSKLNPTSPPFRSLTTPTKLKSMTDFMLPPSQTNQSPAKSKLNPSSPIFTSFGSAIQANDKEAAINRIINNTAATLTPAAKKADSTPSFTRPSNLMNRWKSAAPSSQAYAGPEFLASPAASSLPIPRFLSKSHPDKQKSSSLKSSMGNQRPNSPDKCEDSPTLRKSTLAGECLKHNQYPYGISLRKGKSNKLQKGSNDETTTGTDSSGTQSPPLFPSRRVSPPLSPLNHNFNHSRSAIEGSIGGLFSLESSDGMSSPDLTPEVPRISRFFPIQPSTVLPTQPDRRESLERKRKDQTLSLKKLLMMQVQASSETQPPIQPNGMHYGQPPPITQPETKEGLTLEQPHLLRNLSGPSTTRTSPGLLPAPSYQKAELIQQTDRKLFMPKLASKDPRRLFPSQSDLPMITSILRTNRRLDDIEPPPNPKTSYEKSYCGRSLPWDDRPPPQYHGYGPSGPSPLSVHNAYLLGLSGKSIRDAEVSRSMEAYLQRVIASN